MKKGIFWLLAVAVLCCLALAGCGVTPHPQVTPSTNNDADPTFDTIGYTREKTQAREIYRDFLGGIYNPLKKSSTGTLSPTVPYINMEYGFEVQVNDIKFTVNYKRFFNYNNPDTQAMMFLFSRTGENDSIATMYYFAGEQEDMLYFQLGNDTKNPTQISVPIEKENIFRFVPSESQNQMELLSTTLETLFQLEGTPKYEYRRSNGIYSRHYRFDLNMQKTLLNLLDFADTTQNYIPVGSVEFLIQNLFDVSASEVRAGKVPKIDVRFEFWTLGGEEKVGAGLLDRCVANMKTYDKADPKKCDRDTNFEITKFSVMNTSKEIERKDFSNYKDIFSTPFRIKANLQQNGVPMDLQIDFRVSSDLRHDADHESANVYKGRMYGFAQNKITGKKVMEMSYLDGLFKMKLQLKQHEVEFELPMDLERVITTVAADFYHKDEKADYMKVFTYLIGNFYAHSSTNFSLTLNRAFFEEILLLSPAEFLETMQEFTADGVSVERVLRDAGWSIDEAREYTFSLFMKLDEVQTLIAPISNNDLKIPEAFED